MGHEGFPVVVGWELTLACNLGCKHCASSAGIPRDDELKLDEALMLCDQLPQLLTSEVDFTGGEPLVSPLLFPLVGRLTDLGITCRLVTNGLLLSENVDRILDSGLASIGVSIDGLPSTHDDIRDCEGLFSRVAKGIEMIARAGIDVAAMTCVSDRNIDELDELAKLLELIGVQRWQIQPVFSRGRAGENPSLSLSPGNFKRLCAYARRESEKHSEGCIRVIAADGIGFMGGCAEAGVDWSGCFAGISSCGITSDGKVKGCLSLPDSFVEGDLRKQDLWSIWFGDSAFTYTRQYSSSQLGVMCAGCPEADICKGGCSVMSLSSTRILHNDPYCLYGIARREAAMGLTDR